MMFFALCFCFCQRYEETLYFFIFSSVGASLAQCSFCLYKLVESALIEHNYTAPNLHLTLSCGKQFYLCPHTETSSYFSSKYVSLCKWKKTLCDHFRHIHTVCSEFMMVTNNKYGHQLFYC